MATVTRACSKCGNKFKLTLKPGVSEEESPVCKDCTTVSTLQQWSKVITGM